MRRKYHRIYQDQYEDYISENKKNFSAPEEEYLVKSIRRAIDEWDFGKQKDLKFLDSREEGNAKVRSDAKLFLLSNFHQMIVKPLMGDYKFIPRQKEIEIMRRDCEKDVQVILDQSQRQANNSNEHQNEISGHVIMKVMDRLWRELRMTRMEIWG